MTKYEGVKLSRKIMLEIKQSLNTKMLDVQC